MENFNITQTQFGKLLLYSLPAEIVSNECRLFIFDKNITGKNEKMLFKFLKNLYYGEGAHFRNKLYTIKVLIYNENEIGIDQLVMPKKLIVIDGVIRGFLMPFIENNINLSILLNSKKVPLKVKKTYLIQLGEILRKVQSVEKFKNNFFLGDVHEDNFIVNTDDKRLYAIDLDSCKIGDNHPFPSKYLVSNGNIRDASFSLKYPFERKLGHIPNANSEWLCYAFIVLNFIAQGPIDCLDEKDYYKYLDYLNDLKLSKELLDCFGKIYTLSNNESVEGLIDQIPNNLQKASYNKFIQKIKRKK